MIKPILICLMTFFCAGTNAVAQEVPFGNKVSDKIDKYHRHTPNIATSGAIHLQGLEELKALGFKVIVDLRMPAKETEDEKKAAEEAGLIYYNIPVESNWPSKEELRQFKRLITDKENYPMLLHCSDGNRIGRLWTYYRISEGVNSKQALLEGQTIGMIPSETDEYVK